ncbi:MAG: 16S rRNA (cytidine(1402)-2'-O)-methyltransferase [Mangrovicoccus sp.]
MNENIQALSPGLYLVATPIGNARDITLRALDILRQADVLVAEDTRSLQRLLQIHGIAVNGRKLLPYHDHSGPNARDGLVKLVSAGATMAYASEAGSPLIADPGFHLAQAMREAGLPVSCAPGASAVVTALSLSGLPSDQFLFLGFPPTKSGALSNWLQDAAALTASLVIYESPRRVANFLSKAAEILGPDRPAALCRELTKLYEEIKRGTIQELAEGLADQPPKGECVLVLGGAPKNQEISEECLESALKEALKTKSVKDAASDVAHSLKIPRKRAYQLALTLARSVEKGD